MLNHLWFEVEFPTGLKITRDITFEAGSTAISGKNGTGKSLILEMVCFALFGQEATRGKADDYKKALVELRLTIRGTEYKITRTGKDAQLKVLDEESTGGPPWEILCSGTSPVNKKVTEILGYGYNVFSVGNLIGQGQIEALATMKPADRKKLVDTTIGLDAIESVIKWSGEEASLSRKEADTLESVLVAPQEPVEPDQYVHSDTIKASVEEYGRLKAERDQIQGWLSSAQVEPVVPTCSVTETAESLKEKLDHYQIQVVSLNTAKTALAKIPEAKFTLPELDKMTRMSQVRDEWAAYDKALAAMPPKPVLTSSTIEAMKEDHVRYSAWLQVKDHKISCPNCQHEFHRNGAVEVEEPEYSLAELGAQEGRIRAWATPPEEPKSKRIKTTPTWTQEELNQ